MPTKKRQSGRRPSSEEGGRVAGAVEPTDPVLVDLDADGGESSTATVVAVEKDLDDWEPKHRARQPRKSKPPARDPSTAGKDLVQVVDWVPPGDAGSQRSRRRHRVVRRLRRAVREMRIRGASRLDARRRIPLRHRIRHQRIRRERSRRRAATHAALTGVDGIAQPTRATIGANVAIFVVSIAVLLVVLLLIGVFG